MRPITKDEMLAVVRGGTMDEAALEPDVVQAAAATMRDAYYPALILALASGDEQGAVFELVAAFHAGAMMGLQVAAARS